MANIWVTSDLHFYHKRIMDFCKATRPWASVDEMNEGLMDSLHSTVKKNDTLYLLGDISFGNAEQSLEIAKSLPGQVKYLVLGNHDTHLKGQEVGKYFNHRACIMEHKLFGHKVVMCHYPMLRWNRCQYGSLHLFGHQHGNDIGAKGRCMDVGWDAHGKILNMEEVVSTLLTKEYTCHHGQIKENT